MVLARKPDRRTALEESQLEVRSLRHELATLGTELVVLSGRLALAVTAERDDITLQSAGRIGDIGAALVRRGASA